MADAGYKAAQDARTRAAESKSKAEAARDALKAARAAVHAAAKLVTDPPATVRLAALPWLSSPNLKP